MKPRSNVADIYPHNRKPALDAKVFRSPPAEYRGAPFWSWNNRLDVDQLLRQMNQLKQMGFGGANVHSRTGLDTEYLGAEFMAAVKACTDRARRTKQLIWLYDEDRWPSGFAGGLVTKDPQYRMRYLLWTNTPAGEGVIGTRLSTGTVSCKRLENGTFVGRYEIKLKDGRLHRYRRLADSQSPARGSETWYAYIDTAESDTWFNNFCYVDTLSERAIERFIETTHDRYKAIVGRDFGGAIPAIFADEPQFPKKQAFDRVEAPRDLCMPFTDDLLESYYRAYKQRLEDHLPELFWNLQDDAPSPVRYRFHDHTAERFAAAFSDTISRWCERNDIALTGHMLGEADLYGQTKGGGEVMRALRSFHIPGIDMLSDKMELTTAKQAQSVKHQHARPAMLSELYGVTNWDFDFVGHKAQGDWQAALGVTVRVPHLTWVSMAGEAKRDYPASIGYQSPWWKEYPLVEDHFARINTVLSRGKPIVRVGVLHPIESIWLSYGPTEHNSRDIAAIERQFDEIVEWMCFSGIDFDLVSERSLIDLTPAKPGKRFKVGAMQYDAIVVPSLRTIRRSTLDRLQAFVRAGGRLIFAGDVARCMDGQRSSAPQQVAKGATTVPWNRDAIVDALESVREIDLKHANGTPADSILHQYRSDGDRRHLFLVNTDRQRGRSIKLTINGRWSLTMLDTFTGQSRALPAEIVGSRTVLQHAFEPHDHLLLTLEPAKKQAARTKASPPPKFVDVARLTDPVPVTLDEPNVLLLDYAEWRVGDGAWQPQMEILRLDNEVRKTLNVAPRGGRIPQPWTDPGDPPILTDVQLRFRFRNESPINAPKLAIESTRNLLIRLDGRPLKARVDGWWVDESIHTVPLRSLSPGEHELVLTIPFSRKTDLEWCYLLGDFGVHLAGRHAILTAPVRTLAWGDWTTQGLPFYAGNVTYHATLPPSGAGRVIFPKFRNPLLSVVLDGKPVGKVAFAPFAVTIDASKQDRRLDITAFGNRANAFGCLHHSNEAIHWVGPGAWRSAGAEWQDNYVLKRMGVLAAPIVQTR